MVLRLLRRATGCDQHCWVLSVAAWVCRLAATSALLARVCWLSYHLARLALEWVAEVQEEMPWLLGLQHLLCG